MTDLSGVNDPHTGYRAISYCPQWCHRWQMFNPPIGVLGRLFYSVWRRWLCVRGVHLWDETWSSDEHAFVCDACQLLVNIESIDDTYVQRPTG